ncbi:MAG: thioredoxin domain-containing protein [Rickettsiales bacterium]
MSNFIQRQVRKIYDATRRNIANNLEMKSLITALILIFVNYASADVNTLGNESAPIEIIEYSSFTCPHCASFHQDELPKIKKKYIDTGKVKITHRSMFHPEDIISFRLSMLPYCSGINYHKSLKALMKTQRNWMLETNKHLDVATDIMRLGGMTNEQVEACFKNKEIEDKVLNIQLYAMKDLDLKGTPVFFVNGKRHNGYLRIKDLENIIKEIKNEKS